MILAPSETNKTGAVWLPMAWYLWASPHALAVVFRNRQISRAVPIPIQNGIQCSLVLDVKIVDRVVVDEEVIGHTTHYILCLYV